MRALAVSFCLVAATACGGDTPTAPSGPSVSLGQQFTLAAGETASLSGFRLQVTFMRVTGDSRCPVDAVCIQGGDAIVHVRVSTGETGDYELHTGDSSRASVIHRMFLISLVELRPFPFSGRTIGQEEYRAALVISRP